MREGLGLTQEQLAAKTLHLRRPVARATISALEQGKHSPTAATIVAICKVLHVEPMEVIDRLEVAAGSGVPESASDADLEARLHECLAAEALHEALEILGRLCAREPGPQRIEWTICRARTLGRLGALRAAKAVAERAVSLSSGDPARQADAYLALSEALARLDNLQLALDAAERAVERSHCAAQIQGRARLQQGRVLQRAGRPEDARQAFVAGREQAAACGDMSLSIECEGSAGICLLELGRVREAHMRVLRCVERARRHDMPAREAHWLVELGRIALADGRIADAQRHADAALPLARRCAEWPIVFGATMLRHRITRRVDPADPDRRRVAYLKKILGLAGADDRDVVELRREPSSRARR